MIPSDTTGMDDEEERKRKNAQRLQDIKNNREASIKAAADAKTKAIFDASPEGKLLNSQKDIGDKMKTDIELEKRAQQDALKPMQDLIAEYDSQSTQMKNEADAYEKDQNDLMQQYEGNRLNQVRGQLMSALASRGVDISKLTPEQILQLS